MGKQPLECTFFSLGTGRIPADSKKPHVAAMIFGHVANVCFDARRLRGRTRSYSSRQVQTHAYLGEEEKHARAAWGSLRLPTRSRTTLSGTSAAGQAPVTNLVTNLVTNPVTNLVTNLVTNSKLRTPGPIAGNL